MTNLAQQTLSGLLWLLSAAGIQSVLKLLVLIVLARLLEPADFGLIAAAMVAVSLGEIVSHIGLGPALVQRAAITRRHITSVGFASGFIAGIVVIALWFSSVRIAEFFNIPQLDKIVQALALVLPVSALCVVPQALLQRYMRFREIATFEVAAYLVGYGFVGIVLALSGAGVWALVAAHIFHVVVKLILFAQAAGTVGAGRIHKSETVELLQFGIGFSFAHFGNSLARQVDTIVVGRILDPFSLGLYTRAYGFLAIPANLIGQGLERVLFPVMATKQSDQVRLGHMFLIASAGVALVTLPLSAVLIFSAPLLVDVLLGEKWVGVVFPFQVFATVLVFRTGYKICMGLTKAVGAMYDRAWRQWTYAAAVLAGAWIGTNWGVGGVACGVSAAILLNYLLMLELTRRVCKFSLTRLVSLHLRYLVVALVVALGLYLSVAHLPASTPDALVAALFVFIVVTLGATTLRNRSWLFEMYGNRCIDLIVERFPSLAIIIGRPLRV